MKAISHAGLVVSLGLSLFFIIQALPATAGITVDPDSVGATDVIQDPAGGAFPIENPVDDPLFILPDEIAIGNTAAGTLRVDNGSSVESGNVYVGKGPESTGLVILDGASTIWNAEGFLGIGYNVDADGYLIPAGTGSVIIQNGATLKSIPLGTEYEFSCIGECSESTGSVTVDGSGSVWEDGTDRLDIGSDGVGTLTIKNGGAVIAAGPVVVDPYTTGSRIIFDTGTLTAQAVFSAGSSLEGTGTINTNGWCFDTDIVIAQASDLQHQVVLNDLPGQNVTVDIDLTTGEGRIGIAYNGTASLTIQNGMTLKSNRAYVAYRAGSVGSATVSGAGSKWEDDSDYFQVGFQGNGSLNVQNGGVVTSTGTGYIGQRPDSVGTVTVDGSGSQFSLTASDLYVGSEGNGTLLIQNGGVVTCTGDGYIGRYITAGGVYSNGNVTVSGSGSKFSVGVDFLVGVAGDATLNIQDGGTVDIVGGTWVGYFEDRSGDVTVDGTGSTWNIGDFLAVGYNGNGSLRISDGADVVATTDAILGYNAGSHGTLEIGIGDDGAGLLSCGDLFLGNTVDIAGESTLVVTYDAASMPTVGQEYKIVDFTGALTGTFLHGPEDTTAGSYVIDWDLFYNTNDITLKVVSVTGAPVPGDFNEDGKVDSADLAAWQSNFGMTTGAAHTNGDADEDGDVDGNDFLVWQQQFGQGSSSSLNSQAIPEPSTILLGALLLLGLGYWNRR